MYGLRPIIIILFIGIYLIPFSQKTKVIAPVKLDEKWGYIDRSGNYFIAPTYDNLESFIKTPIGYLSKVNYGYSGELIDRYYNEYRISSNGKWGLIDNKGEIIVPIIYDNIILDSTLWARVQLEGKWGYLNLLTKRSIDCMFDSCFSFSENLAAVEFEGKWGVIDTKGKVIIPTKYSSVGLFVNGSCTMSIIDANNKKKYGVIDHNGDWIIKPEYDFMSNLSPDGDYVIYWKDNNCGYIEILTKKENSIPFYIQSFDYWKYAIIQDTTTRLYGYFDAVSMSVLITPQFSEAHLITGKDFFSARLRNGIQAILIATDTTIIEMNCKGYKNFATWDGNLMVFKDPNTNLYGYCTSNCEFSIPSKYLYALGYSCNYAAVQTKDAKWGFIDESGEWKILPVFDDAYSFVEITQN